MAFNREDVGKLCLRLMLGGMMLFHGFAKFDNPDAMVYINNLLYGAGYPQWLSFGVYAGEIVAPLLVIVGCFVEVAGIIMMVNMVFAIVLVHSAEVFSLGPHGGWAIELQAFYLFSALAVVLLGAGRYTVMGRSAD